MVVNSQSDLSKVPCLVLPCPALPCPALPCPALSGPDQVYLLVIPGRNVSLLPFVTLLDVSCPMACLSVHLLPCWLVCLLVGLFACLSVRLSVSLLVVCLYHGLLSAVCQFRCCLPVPCYLLSVMPVCHAPDLARAGLHVSVCLACLLISSTTSCCCCDWHNICFPQHWLFKMQ